jgi:hypothetical protein
MATISSDPDLDQDPTPRFTSSDLDPVAELEALALLAGGDEVQDPIDAAFAREVAPPAHHPVGARREPFDRLL